MQISLIPSKIFFWIHKNLTAGSSIIKLSSHIKQRAMPEGHLEDAELQGNGEVGVLLWWKEAL